MEKVPLEYSSLYKFLVSVGVLVLLADGLFVWAMLQLSAVLTFPERNFVELTESGSKSVEIQQQYLMSLISQTPRIGWVCCTVR